MIPVIRVPRTPRSFTSNCADRPMGTMNRISGMVRQCKTWLRPSQSVLLSNSQYDVQPRRRWRATQGPGDSGAMTCTHETLGAIGESPWGDTLGRYILGRVAGLVFVLFAVSVIA